MAYRYRLDKPLLRNLSEKLSMVLDASQFIAFSLSASFAGDHGHSFDALARRFHIPGGRRAVSSWHRQWNGTPLSLERKPGSGRRALLTPTQVARLITKPIRRCNRNHVAVEYPQLLESMEQELGHPVSLRTLQRYGREEGKVHCESTIPRTPEERMTSWHAA